MSTKSSIKWKQQTKDEAGFHLYDDVIDSMHMDGEPPVYLRLDGVDAELHTLEHGACVTVTIPRSMARELGLVPSPPAADSEGKQK